MTRFETDCDLETLKTVDILAPLLDLRKQLIKGINQWAAQKGLERFEGGAGYFLALAFYWFKIQNYQASLLLIHRSIDCILQLLGYREPLVIPTTSGLKYNDASGDLVSFFGTFNRLIQGTAIFNDADDVLVEQKYGKLIWFRPEEGKLLVGTNKYYKIK